jgi:hypothetical protein
VTLDKSRIAHFIELVGERLRGDWLLVGGAAAALWFRDQRVTEDVDLFGLDGTNRERADLLDLAAAESFPLEIVNTTADWFVRRIPDWREQLEVLHRGPNAVVYRPTATLYLLLKAARLTETDLDDCLALIAFADANQLAVDWARVAAAVDALAETPDEALMVRREKLRTECARRATGA